MNSEFPRLLALMRAESHISQKQAAADLGISQALLSHYEKGIRECGLDFVVKAADYYKVSCDYLLGRTPIKNGAVIFAEDLPVDENENAKAGGDSLTLQLVLNKKLIFNSINIIYSYLQKAKNKKLAEKVSSFFMNSIYSILRILHLTDKNNPKAMFTIPASKAFAYANAQMQKDEVDAISLAQGNEKDEVVGEVKISTNALTEEYPQFAPSILNLIKNTEDLISQKTK